MNNDTPTIFPTTNPATTPLVTPDDAASDKESEIEDIIYDSNIHQIKVIYNNEQDKKEIIFDLVARDLIIKFQDENKSNSKWSCELK